MTTAPLSVERATAEARSAREASAEDVHSFVSRPGLHPPRLNVVWKATEEVGDGYVFIAPFGQGQDGPMIVDNRGRVVWFNRLNKGRAFDFKVQRYRGRPVLTWWNDGAFVIVNDRYQKIATVRPAGDYPRGNLHDFIITSRDTALFLIYHVVQRDTPTTEGDSKRPVKQVVVQEVNIKTGDLLFEWHSLDHIGLDESYVAPPDDIKKNYDYIHANSIAVGNDGDLLLSGRHTSAVYNIDRDTGEVIWRLGGKESDFQMSQGTRFWYQHDARQLPDGDISIYDNGARVHGKPQHKQSRGIILEVNEEAMQVTMEQLYESPGDLLSGSMGNMQVLPNGNAFIGWGHEPRFTEYAPGGRIIFDVRLPSQEIFSYRAFRFPWEGMPAPPGKPAVAARTAGPGKLHVFASWNGATEVATWQVLAGPSPDALQPVTSRAYTGFETRITAATNDAYLAVRARTAQGETLATSPVIQAPGSPTEGTVRSLRR